MVDPVFWLVFFSAALALNLSPGPDLLYVISRTLSGGRPRTTMPPCGGPTTTRLMRRRQLLQQGGG